MTLDSTTAHSHGSRGGVVRTHRLRHCSPTAVNGSRTTRTPDHMNAVTWLAVQANRPLEAAHSPPR
jgi:hypothetical protein